MTEFENVNPNIKRIITFHNTPELESEIHETASYDADQSSNNSVKLVE